MKKIFIILVFILAATGISAQQDSTFNDFQKKAKQDFDNYLKQAEKDFSDYRDKENAKYEAFLRKSWEEFNAFDAIPIPPSPEPITPPTVKPEVKPTADPIPYAEIVPVPKLVVPPKPFHPIPPPVKQPVKRQTLDFPFFGSECKVSLEPKQKITLSDLSNNSIANAWKQLSGSAYNALINDCLSLRDELKTGDWGYYQLVKKMSETHYRTASNEATLLQMYILTQSGYKVRIAKTNNRLTLLIPFRQSIFEYSYLQIAGMKYYVMDRSLKGSTFHVCDHEFPREQFFSLQLDAQPDFDIVPTTPKTFTTERNPQIRASVATNQNLIDFYNTYPPMSEWNLHVRASLSTTVKSSLYPALKTGIAGKTQTEAANILLDFVQHAFKYQTDNQQFGYERPLFADETFFYPASDCEDRSILFS
ncbi:MAG: hypothetical protein LBU22_00040, partial [Dysgonamonadaceae bacterium]|nr:hypothetical protein [Dysgonamonadaceae bacterium]